jgi:hypothetical protein
MDAKELHDDNRNWLEKTNASIISMWQENRKDKPAQGTNILSVVLGRRPEKIAEQHVTLIIQTVHSDPFATETYLATFVRQERMKIH